MSAFAAIFNLDGSPVDPGEIRSMIGAVAHRGPDGIGTWTSGSVGLAASLLKATPEADFETLPLVTENGRYALAFDGRVDNRAELARALKIDSNTLATVPDSALLMAAYCKWGKRCLDHVAGDFAFALWDASSQELFCGRDPVGVRMLHYYCDGKRFVAASEVSQVLAVVDAKLDRASLARFLDVRGPSVDGTFLEGVKKLPGGCQLSVSKSGVKVETYWNPDPSDLLRLKDDREYEERFLELFKESITARLRSVSPVAVSLSGGMDSSSVIATAEFMRKTDSLPEVRYYSNVYSDLAEVDESEYTRQVVDMYGIPGRMIESGDFNDPELGSSPIGLKRSEPYIAPHEESHRRLFVEAQRDGCTSLLTGLGGDEIFAVGRGYLSDLFRGFDLRSIKREWRYFTRRAWLSAGFDALISMIPTGLTARLSGEEPVTAPWLTSDALSHLKDESEPAWQSDRRFKSLHQAEVNNWIQVRGGLPGHTWTDVTLAEYGIEPRHPFMDRRIVEFMASVPPEVKYRYGYNKRVLRRAMKGILPEGVRNRRYKTNFSSLYDVKATESDAGETSELFRSPLLAEMGLVEPETLRQAWSRYQESAGDADDDLRTAMWTAISLEQWLRERAGSGDTKKAQRVSA